MIYCTQLIDGTCKAIFDLSQDYKKRLAWDPFPESYRFLNGEVVDKGLQVLVNAKNGLSMEIEYVSFSRPKAAAIKMIRGPWFIREFAGTWSFKDTNQGKCEVTFKYNIKGNPRFLSFIVTPILELIFRRNAARRLKALKNYVQANNQHRKGIKDQ